MRAALLGLGAAVEVLVPSDGVDRYAADEDTSEWLDRAPAEAHLPPHHRHADPLAPHAHHAHAKVDHTSDSVPHFAIPHYAGAGERPGSHPANRTHGELDTERRAAERSAQPHHAEHAQRARPHLPAAGEHAKTSKAHRRHAGHAEHVPREARPHAASAAADAAAADAALGDSAEPLEEPHPRHASEHGEHRHGTASGTRPRYTKRKAKRPSHLPARPGDEQVADDLNLADENWRSFKWLMTWCCFWTWVSWVNCVAVFSNVNIWRIPMSMQKKGLSTKLLASMLASRQLLKEKAAQQALEEQEAREEAIEEQAAVTDSDSQADVDYSENTSVEGSESAQ